MRGRWLTAVMLSVVLCLSALPARADDSLDRWTHGFYVLACDHDPGVPPLRDAVFPPDGCREQRDVQLVLETPEGYSAGYCLTREDGWCRLSGEFSQTYLVRVIGDDPVPGYTALANPTIYTRETAIGTGFVFIPNDEFATIDGTASLTAHFRVCPTDYAGADFFADCHDTAPDYVQTLEVYGPRHRSARSGGDGNAVLDRLDAGDYTVNLAFPATTLSASVFCADAANPGVEIPSSTSESFEQDSRRAYTHLALAAGADVICDVYAIPSSATPDTALITFHFRTCDEIVAPDLIYDACHGNGSPGLFEVYGSDARYWFMGVRDDQGNATILVPPGHYAAAHGPGHNIGSEYIYCSQNGVDDSGIEGFPTVTAGEAWTCDVYIHFVTFK